MYQAFPGSDYYEGSAPTPDHRRTPRLAPRRGDPDRFPRSLSFGRQDRRPAIPLRPGRDGHAAHATNPRQHEIIATEDREPAKCSGSHAPLRRPVSIGFEPGGVLRGFGHWYRSRYASLPRLPGPRRPIIPT